MLFSFSWSHWAHSAQIYFLHNIPSRLRSQNIGNDTKIILQGKGRSSSIFQYFVYEQQGFDGPNSGTKYLQKNYSYLSVEIRQSGLAEKLRTLSSTYLKELYHEIFDPFCGQNPIQNISVPFPRSYWLRGNIFMWIRNRSHLKIERFSELFQPIQTGFFFFKEGFNHF